MATDARRNLNAAYEPDPTGTRYPASTGKKVLELDASACAQSDRAGCTLAAIADGHADLKKGLDVLFNS